MDSNNNSPFFSVVIPIHNKLPHLERSINSVLTQAFQDFEILLVDDASTDGCSEKINEFDDPRIRVFTRTEPGPGGYAARNLGIEKAKGEWIAFLDADDEWYSYHLEKMNELAKIYPEVYFMSCGWQTQKGCVKRENKFYSQNKKEKKKKITVDDYLKFGIKNQLPVWTSVAVIKRMSPMAENLFPADSGAKRGGDLHAWLKMICFHKQMVWSNHIGAIYHLESVNMVTKKAGINTFLLNENALKELNFNLENNTKKLLIKYLNFRLKNALKASQNKGLKTEGLVKALHWKGDYLNVFFICVIYLVPIYSLNKFLRK